MTIQHTLHTPNACVTATASACGPAALPRTPGARSTSAQCKAALDSAKHSQRTGVTARRGLPMSWLRLGPSGADSCKRSRAIAVQAIAAAQAESHERRCAANGHRWNESAVRLKCAWHITKALACVACTGVAHGACSSQDSDGLMSPSTNESSDGHPSQAAATAAHTCTRRAVRSSARTRRYSAEVYARCTTASAPPAASAAPSPAARRCIFAPTHPPRQYRGTQGTLRLPWGYSLGM
jgi:hypothetical protein